MKMKHKVVKHEIKAFVEDSKKKNVNKKVGKKIDALEIRTKTI